MVAVPSDISSFFGRSTSHILQAENSISKPRDFSEFGLGKPRDFSEFVNLMYVLLMLFATRATRLQSLHGFDWVLLRLSIL